MRKTNRRRLLNLLAFALLAFVIYLTVFYKDEEGTQAAPAAKTATAKVEASSHH